MSNRCLLLGLFLVVSSAHAEIYECDGKWTNRPCEGAIERTMHEVPAAELNVEDVVQKQKESAQGNAVAASSEPLAPRYSISRKLKKLSKELMEKHQIGLTKEQLNAFEDQCTADGVTIAACQAEYDRVAQGLNAKVQEKLNSKK